jgi:hypothetical protein
MAAKSKTDAVRYVSVEEAIIERLQVIQDYVASQIGKYAKPKEVAAAEAFVAAAGRYEALLALWHSRKRN